MDIYESILSFLRVATYACPIIMMLSFVFIAWALSDIAKAFFRERDEIRKAVLELQSKKIQEAIEREFNVRENGKKHKGS